MKRRLTVLLMLLAAFAPLMAQEGLQVARVFERFGHEKGCKMVEMHDATLRGHQMRVYKSLTYKHIAPLVAPYLDAERKHARKIRDVVEDGRVVSGYYMMPALPDGQNRYVLFSNGSNGSGAVIYIEGRLKPDDILRLCYSRNPRK